MTFSDDSETNNNPEVNNVKYNQDGGNLSQQRYASISYSLWNIMHKISESVGRMTMKPISFK